MSKVLSVFITLNNVENERLGKGHLRGRERDRGEEKRRKARE